MVRKKRKSSDLWTPKRRFLTPGPHRKYVAGSRATCFATCASKPTISSARFLSVSDVGIPVDRIRRQAARMCVAPPPPPPKSFIVRRASVGQEIIPRQKTGGPFVHCELIIFCLVEVFTSFEQIFRANLGYVIHIRVSISYR